MNLTQKCAENLRTLILICGLGDKHDDIIFINRRKGEKIVRRLKKKKKSYSFVRRGRPLREVRPEVAREPF